MEAKGGETDAANLAPRKANRRRFRVAGGALLCNPPRDYLQAGSPSPAVETIGFVVLMPMPQVAPVELRVRVRRGPVAGARRDRRSADARRRRLNFSVRGVDRRRVLRRSRRRTPLPP